jgi:hypothetical protein
MQCASLKSNQLFCVNNWQAVYSRCAVPDCLRIFSLSSELCSYSDLEGGFMCPVCSIDAQENHPRVITSAVWNELFDTFSNLEHKSGSTLSGSVRKAASKVPPCDICIFNIPKFRSAQSLSKRAAKALKYKVKRTPHETTSELRSKRKSRDVYHLPGWDFSLSLCSMHAEDAEFIHALKTRRPILRQNAECVRKRRCGCSNGIYTCTGRITLGFCVGVWSNLQETAKIYHEISKKFSCMHPTDQQKRFNKKQRTSDHCRQSAQGRRN